MSTAFHHLGITLGSVIDNVIEMIPEWPFQDSLTGDPFQNRNHLCRRKKNDVCLSLNGKNYGKSDDISKTYYWEYERYIFGSPNMLSWLVSYLNSFQVVGYPTATVWLES